MHDMVYLFVVFKSECPSVKMRNFENSTYQITEQINIPDDQYSMKHA